MHQNKPWYLLCRLFFNMWCIAKLLFKLTHKSKDTDINSWQALEVTSLLRKFSYYKNNVQTVSAEMIFTKPSKCIYATTQCRPKTALRFSLFLKTYTHAGYNYKSRSSWHLRSDLPCLDVIRVNDKLSVGVPKWSSVIVELVVHTFQVTGCKCLDTPTSWKWYQSFPTQFCPQTNVCFMSWMCQCGIALLVYSFGKTCCMSVH